MVAKTAEGGSSEPFFAGGGAGGESVGGADAVGVGCGAAGGDPAEDREAYQEEKEEEGLLDEIIQNREVEMDGEAAGGAGGEALSGDDPEACAEEEQEVEGARERGCAGGWQRLEDSSRSDAPGVGLDSL